MGVLHDITEFELDALVDVIAVAGAKPFHARQIFRWLYRHNVTDITEMTDLSLDLRTQLANGCRIPTPAVKRADRSRDGTMKLLLELDDHRQIESVFIPDTPRMTFCVSTQVGCAMRCSFCLTGKMGLGAEPFGGGDHKSGAGAGPSPGAGCVAVQHRLDGNG